MRLNTWGERAGSRTGSRSRYSMSTAAASSRSRSSWASSRIGSATWRTSPSARHGWSSRMSDTTLRPGMSRAPTMVNPAVSKPRRRRKMSPQGTVERIVRAWSRPGSVKSSTYSARPAAFAAPSFRTTLRPTARLIAVPEGESPALWPGGSGCSPPGTNSGARRECGDYSAPRGRISCLGRGWRRLQGVGHVDAEASTSTSNP